MDDLTRGYLLAAQSGEVFNLSDASRDTVMHVAGTAAQAAGQTRQQEFIPAAKTMETH